MSKKSYLTTLILFCFIVAALAQDRNNALKNWHDNKFSMFIHFGVYSELGGVWQGKPVTRGYSEQVQAHAGILTDVYDDVPTRFNPVKWNADSIASLAKNAGMRSIVITSKHHDGFCMYHSAYTRFNVVDASPFGRDVIKELGEACRRAGLNFGLYYSLIDYRLHPIADSNANPITNDHHEYNKKQVTELLTKYGPITEMWFDMGSLTERQSREIYELVHQLQPGCMVSGRLGNNAYDFCVMGDNEYPEYKIDTPWQTPASMFDETWGYRSWQKRENAPGKMKEKLLSLIKVVSRGGNYLLNIGPKGDGSVVPFEAEVLTGIGRWLEKNGEAIYGTSANPLPGSFQWGEITTNENCLYLVLSGKQQPILELPGISGKVKKASILDGLQNIKTSYSRGILKIQVPATCFNGDDIRVVKLEFDGHYRLLPEQLITGPAVNLNFQNCIKHYSYSCIDYYTNHRSIVKQTWNFKKSQKTSSPVIFFTREELGKEIELTWNGQMQIFRFEVGEKVPVNTLPGTIKWENRYAYGPYNSDFESNPGEISGEINPSTEWIQKDGRKWKLSSGRQDGLVESIVSRPIQSRYILQEILSDKTQNQLIEIAAGDGIQVWLNGENLVTHNNPRESKLLKEIVLLPLKQGKNQLLIKFYNRFGYLSECSISNRIDQSFYCKRLSPISFEGINNCEIKLHNPESRHQPIRMNNVNLQL